MFIAIGESIIARVAALGGYISFSVTDRPKTPYEQVLYSTVLLWLVFWHATECSTTLLA